jgi:hypothetical protein
MPKDERCVSVSAGYYHSLVLTDDGQILAVSASESHSLTVDSSTVSFSCCLCCNASLLAARAWACTLGCFPLRLVSF